MATRTIVLIIAALLAAAALVAGLNSFYDSVVEASYKSGYDAHKIESEKILSDLKIERDGLAKKAAEQSTEAANAIAALKVELRTKRKEQFKEVKNEALVSVPTDSGEVSEEFIKEWNSLSRKNK